MKCSARYFFLTMLSSTKSFAKVASQPLHFVVVSHKHSYRKEIYAITFHFLLFFHFVIASKFICVAIQKMTGLLRHFVPRNDI